MGRAHEAPPPRRCQPLRSDYQSVVRRVPGVGGMRAHPHAARPAGAQYLAQRIHRGRSEERQGKVRDSGKEWSLPHPTSTRHELVQPKLADDPLDGLDLGRSQRVAPR
jgi:hypothetical protein